MPSCPAADDSHNTWEPESSFYDKSVIADFENRVKQRRKRKLSPDRAESPDEGIASSNPTPEPDALPSPSPADAEPEHDHQESSGRRRSCAFFLGNVRPDYCSFPKWGPTSKSFCYLVTFPGYETPELVPAGWVHDTCPELPIETFR